MATLLKVAVSVSQSESDAQLATLREQLASCKMELSVVKAGRTTLKQELATSKLGLAIKCDAFTEVNAEVRKLRSFSDSAGLQQLGEQLHELLLELSSRPTSDDEFFLSPPSLTPKEAEAIAKMRCIMRVPEALRLLLIRRADVRQHVRAKARLK